MKPVILVADDEEICRSILCEIITELGIIISVSDGLEAWEMLQHSPVSLLITDLKMPNMDGYELVDKVRSDARFDEMPILVISSAVPTMAPDHPLRSKVQGLIGRPFGKSMEEFKVLIMDLLKKNGHKS